MPKKSKNIDLLCEHFTDMFNNFNKIIFENKLKLVDITFNVKQKFAFKYNIKTHELMIGHEIADLKFNEIPISFLHEIVHCAVDQFGLSESTPNQYHSKKYMQIATDAGFFVVRHKTQGWAITSTIYPRNVIDKRSIGFPTEESVKNRIKAFEFVLNKSLIEKSFREIKNDISADKQTKTFFLKYECSCPPPHNSIRSGRRPDGKNALNIVCQYCDTAFRCVSKLSLQ